MDVRGGAALVFRWAVMPRALWFWLEKQALGCGWYNHPAPAARGGCLALRQRGVSRRPRVGFRAFEQAAALARSRTLSVAIAMLITHATDRHFCRRQPEHEQHR